MLRRDHNLRWTPHMEESLRLFMEQPECEGDRILAVQVRCAQIAEQMNDFLIQQSLSGESQTSPYFIRALDGQLQEIWRTLPEITATSQNGESSERNPKATAVVESDVLLLLFITPASTKLDTDYAFSQTRSCFTCTLQRSLSTSSPYTYRPPQHTQTSCTAWSGCRSA